MTIEHVYRNLLTSLPLHAEEDSLREEIAETELVTSVQGRDIDAIVATTAVAAVRRLFECLALLDPPSLAKGHWAFVSFPASLMARSVLETLATPGNTFFTPEYWTQGAHRPTEIAEEQRALLRRLELQRTTNPKIDVLPIRTVHVSWGIIRLGAKYLLHKREDQQRSDVAGYVFPGGRLNLTDLPVDARNSTSLRELFSTDSTLAKCAHQLTLVRELHQELELTPIDYQFNYLRTLTPFRKVEGTKNNHSYTEYNIAVYSVKLQSDGELKVLDKAASTPTDWAWFEPTDLVFGKRPDGLRPYVDALVQDSSLDVMQFLSETVPDSSTTPPFIRNKSDAVELPPSADMPILKGDSGRQKPLQIALDQSCWELLMLLGWHARGLKFRVGSGLLIPLGGGWVKLKDPKLLECAARLAKQFAEIDFRLVECHLAGHCRLSIDAEHLFFRPECFVYHLDFESVENPVVLTLRDIELSWATLIGRTLIIQLSPKTKAAVITTARGRIANPDDLETVQREMLRVMTPATAIGLHQFLKSEVIVKGQMMKARQVEYRILVPEKYG